MGIDHQKLKKYSNICLVCAVIAASMTLIYVFFIFQPEPPQHQYEYDYITVQDIRDQVITGFSTVDIRPEVEYNISHIGGAINAPYGCSSCVKDIIYENVTTTNIVLYGDSLKCERVYQWLERDYRFNENSLYILDDWAAWVD